MLTGRQKLELALLLGEFEDRREQPGAVDAGLSLLVGYVLAERIAPGDFSDADRRELPDAFAASKLAPEGVAAGVYATAPPGTSGADVLAHAGMLFEQVKTHRQECD